MSDISPIVVVPYADYGPPRSVPYYYRFRSDGTGVSASVAVVAEVPAWPQQRRLSVSRVPQTAVGLYMRSAGDTSQSSPTIHDELGSNIRVVPYATAGFPGAVRNLLWSQDIVQADAQDLQPETGQWWRSQRVKSEWVTPTYGLLAASDDDSAPDAEANNDNIFIVAYDTTWYDVPPQLRQFHRAVDEGQPQQPETGQSTRFIHHVGKLTVAQWLLHQPANDTETDAPQHFEAETNVNMRPIHRPTRHRIVPGLLFPARTDEDFPVQPDTPVNMRPVHVPTRHRVLAAYRFVPATDFAAPGAAATHRRRHPPWRRRQDQTFARVTGD